MKQIMLLLLVSGACLALNAQQVKKVSIDELEQYIQKSDRPLVVNFWATFCKSCIEEIPFFIQSRNAHPGVELVLVSLDLPDYYPAKVESFLRKKAFGDATHFWLDETNADTFCPRIDPLWEGAMPVTLFVNRSSNYRRFVGRPMTGPQVIEAFEELVR